MSVEVIKIPIYTVYVHSDLCSRALLSLFTISLATLISLILSKLCIRPTTFVYGTGAFSSSVRRRVNMHRPILTSSIFVFTPTVLVVADSFSSSLSNAVKNLSQIHSEDDVQQILDQITANAPAIDSLAKSNASSSSGSQTFTNGFSAKSKASIACEISNILFPSGYVGPNSPENFTQEEDINWWVHLWPGRPLNYLFLTNFYCFIGLLIVNYRQHAS